jgi:hypothetical protein
MVLEERLPELEPRFTMVLLQESLSLKVEDLSNSIRIITFKPSDFIDHGLK